ncbi:MAG: DMT family transporter [Phascolarctobacterium sp.]|nr:DMT family transporter [Phascolarctobacterium sp.]
MGILSSLAYAYYTVKPAEMLKKYTAASLIGWGQLISGLALIILCNTFDQPVTWDAGAVMAFTYFLFGETILSYSVYLAGLKLVGSTKASLISCAEPLASIAVVVTLLGTKLTIEDYLGMACIIFTSTMLSLPKK